MKRQLKSSSSSEDVYELIGKNGVLVGYQIVTPAGSLWTEPDGVTPMPARAPKATRSKKPPADLPADMVPAARWIKAETVKGATTWVLYAADGEPIFASDTDMLPIQFQTARIQMNARTAVAGAAVIGVASAALGAIVG